MAERTVRPLRRRMVHRADYQQCRRPKNPRYERLPGGVRRRLPGIGEGRSGEHGAHRPVRAITEIRQPFLPVVRDEWR